MFFRSAHYFALSLWLRVPLPHFHNSVASSIEYTRFVCGLRVHMLHTTYFYCFPAQYRKFFSNSNMLSSVPLHFRMWARVCAACERTRAWMCVFLFNIEECASMFGSLLKNYFVVFLFRFMIFQCSVDVAVAFFLFFCLAICMSCCVCVCCLVSSTFGVYAVSTSRNKSSIQLFNHSLHKRTIDVCENRRQPSQPHTDTTQFQSDNIEDMRLPSFGRYRTRPKIYVDYISHSWSLCFFGCSLYNVYSFRSTIGA